MTNEEAVKMLKAKLKCLIKDVSGVYDDCNRGLCNECYLNYEQGNMGQQAEYLRMSIEALKQKPCEDCISRQAVLEVIEREEFKGDAISEIEKLSPVTPQHTDAEIQKMQEMEQAEIQKAYELGKASQPQESEKIDCESTKCENCINHNYCEYELQRK